MNKTYRVTYTVMDNDGYRYDVVQKGVIGFSLTKTFICFSYLLTDTNRRAGEGFSIDGTLTNLTVELE